MRCEENLVKQCATRDKKTGEYIADEARGDKIHPQGKEYGYEKNADWVKGQHGEAVSAEHRAEGHEFDDEHEMQTEEEREHEQEHADKDKAEAAEKIKKAKAKAKNKGQEKPGKAEKEK